MEKYIHFLMELDGYQHVVFGLPYSEYTIVVLSARFSSR